MPESQKLWEKSSTDMEGSSEHELAQTVVSGRGTQEPLASQVWQVGQAETSQQNPSVQLPVVH